MKLKNLFFSFVCLFSTLGLFGQFSFQDNASNAAYSSGWSNLTNGGNGFNAWVISSGGANAGTFIGNPSSNGMGTSGIGTTAFVLFGHSGHYVNAVRYFGRSAVDARMQIGDSFTFYWAMNWDAGSGNKGFDLRAGGTTIFNVNNAGSSTISTSNGNASTIYGTEPMLVTLTRTSWTQYSFTMTRRNAPLETFSTTINSSSAIDNINIYCGAQSDNNGNRNIYFNNFTFTKANPYAINGDVTEPRILQGSGNLTKTGVGHRLSLTGPSTFTGNTTVSEGFLVITADNNLGAAPGSPTAGKISVGNGSFEMNGTFTLNANRGITLTNANSALDVYGPGTNVVTYNGIIAHSGTHNLRKLGGGVLVLGGNNTYTGATRIEVGTLRISAAERIDNNSNLILAGGTFSTGATTGNTETMNTLQLLENSTIAFGTGNHNLNFSASDAVSWTAARTLTITGWTGTAGQSGTGGKIFVGNTASGLTATQLAQITFSGYPGTAVLLSTGEIVPRAQMYRSKQTGNWNQIATWEFSNNGGVSWANATVTPTSAVGSISISNTHTVTVTAAVSADEVTVASGGTLALSGANLTIVDGAGDDLTVSGTMNCGTQIVDGAGSFVLASGANLSTANTNGITSSGASGSIQNTGSRSFSTGANYTFNGSAAQVTGSGLPSAINNLTVNNASGVSLSASTTVVGNLTMTAGRLSIGNFDLLLNGTFVGGSATEYINTNGTGMYKPRVAATGANTFHIGGNSSYTPVMLNFTAASFGSDPRLLLGTNLGAPTAFNDTANINLVDRTWTIEPQDITGFTYTIQFNYTTGEITMGTSESDLLPVKYSGGIWYKPVGSLFEAGIAQGTASINIATNTVTWSGLTTFSQFLIVQNSSSPLPVTLTAFNANCQDGQVVLQWTTASEFNASHFDVEMSRDGSVWNQIGRLNAAGTTNQTSNYEFVTPNLGALTYFRLVQVDFDGMFEIFGPVSSSCDLKENSLAVFPNPASEQFTIDIKALEASTDAAVFVTDMMGKVIYTQTVLLEAGSNQVVILGNGMHARTYTVRIHAENQQFETVRLVIK